MPKLWRPRVLPVQKRQLSPKSWELLKASDAELLNAELVKSSTVKSLRKTINKVPVAERGVDWVERVISIYAILSEKGRRNASLIASVERIRNEAGEPEKFATFKARLVDQLKSTSAKRKFNMSFEFSDHEQALSNLKTLFDVLQQEGYDAFVNSGTLLGAVRDQDFIAHDYDADLAVVLKGDTDLEVIASFNKLFADLYKHYGEILRPRLKCKRPVIKVKTHSGLVIDLFPVWERDGRVFIWPHTHGELTMDDVLPLQDCTIKTETFPAPKNPEKMLVLNYGEGWNTPDSTFKFPWADAKIKFADFLSAYQEDTKRVFIDKLLFRKSKP